MARASRQAERDRVSTTPFSKFSKGAMLQWSNTALPQSRGQRPCRNQEKEEDNDTFTCGCVPGLDCAKAGRELGWTSSPPSPLLLRSAPPEPRQLPNTNTVPSNVGTDSLSWCDFSLLRNDHKHKPHYAWKSLWPLFQHTAQPFLARGRVSPTQQTVKAFLRDTLHVTIQKSL